MRTLHITYCAICKTTKLRSLCASALSRPGSVQLLTIHKSKGLEFDKVFVFYNLSFRGKPDYNQIVSYIDYMGEDYKQLRDFAISLHYAKLIEESSFSYLAAADKRREMLEELNTLYVAFTRAVERLNIYFTFKSSAPWPDYYDAIARIDSASQIYM